MWKKYRWFIFFGICFLHFKQIFAQSLDLQVPHGWTISVFASHLPKVRSMVFGEDGNLYATSNEGKVYRIDKQGSPVLIVTGLSNPLGIVYYDGSLIISSSASIYRLKDPQSVNSPQQLQTLEALYQQLPKERWHGGKYMTIMGDSLLVNIGMPCNICHKGKPYGSIVAFSLKSMPFPSYQTVAQGIRNSVGFDRDPISGDLFFSDNGQDNLGENFPRDELNRVRLWGEHFGFPYFANNRPNHGFPAPKGLKVIPPVYLFPPHSAPLGIHFYRSKNNTQEYRNNLFVAMHGSWARKKEPKTRYMVVRLIMDQKSRKVIKMIPFITGFLQGQNAIARPVDIKEDNQGALYLSDDFGGKIYRISKAR